MCSYAYTYVFTHVYIYTHKYIYHVYKKSVQIYVGFLLREQSAIWKALSDNGRLCWKLQQGPSAFLASLQLQAPRELDWVAVEELKS